MPTATAARTDAVLAAAVDQTYQAAVDISSTTSVGDHLGMEMDGERLGTHYFVCTDPGYPGWRWAVTVARAPRARRATICETHLVPGDGALLSTEWLPYAQRLAPGDVGPGDVTPYREEDDNLEPGFEATGEEDVDQMAFFELGLGRARVLSAQGRDAAATRWYDGEHGPASTLAKQAPAACSSCGYFLPMAGALRAVFGVCANHWSPSDGAVVSLDHGCGAHSEVDIQHHEPDPIEAPVLDDNDLEIVER